MTAQIKMTRKEAEVQMACFRQTFSSVRLLNEKAVLHAPQAHSKRTELECRVLHEKRQLTTLDVTPQRAEQIFARYVEVDGEPCVLELVQDLTCSRIPPKPWCSADRCSPRPAAWAKSSTATR